MNFGLALPDTAAEWLVLGGTHAAVASLLAAAVWGVARVWQNPHGGRVLWLGVVLKLACPPLVAVALLWPAPPQNRDRQGASPAASPSPAAPAVAERTPVNRDRQGAPRPAPPSRPLPTVDVPTVRTAPLPAAESRKKSTGALPDGRGSWGGSFSPAIVLVAVWAAGAVLLWLLAAVRSVRFGTALRRLPDGNARLARLLATAADRMNVPVPRLKVSPGVGPLVWAEPFGRRATVVVPAGLFDTLPDRQAVALLTHECAHLARRDHLVRWLELLACGLWWWLPTAWLAAAAGRRCEELCCDAAVLAAGRDEEDGGGDVAAAYAEALLAAAAYLSESRRPAVPVPASGVGRPPFLKRRFEMILKDKLPARPGRRVRWPLTAAALLAAVVGVSFAGPPGEEPADIPDPPPAAPAPPAADPLVGSDAEPAPPAAEPALTHAEAIAPSATFREALEPLLANPESAPVRAALAAAAFDPYVADAVRAKSVRKAVGGGPLSPDRERALWAGFLSLLELADAAAADLPPYPRTHPPETAAERAAVARHAAVSARLKEAGLLLAVLHARDASRPDAAAVRGLARYAAGVWGDPRIGYGLDGGDDIADRLLARAAGTAEGVRNFAAAAGAARWGTASGAVLDVLWATLTFEQSAAPLRRDTAAELATLAAAPGPLREAARRVLVDSRVESPAEAEERARIELVRERPARESATPAPLTFAEAVNEYNQFAKGTENLTVGDLTAAISREIARLKEGGSVTEGKTGGAIVALRLLLESQRLPPGVRFRVTKWKNSQGAVKPAALIDPPISTGPILVRPAGRDTGLSADTRAKIAAALAAAAKDDALPIATRLKLLRESVEPGGLTGEQNARLAALLVEGMTREQELQHRMCLVLAGLAGEELLGEDWPPDGLYFEAKGPLIETMAALGATAPGEAAAFHVAVLGAERDGDSFNRRDSQRVAAVTVLNRTAGSVDGLRGLLAAARRPVPELPANFPDAIEGPETDDVVFSLRRLQDEPADHREAVDLLLDTVRHAKPTTDEAAAVLLDAAASDDPAVRAAAVEALAGAAGG